MKNVTLLAFSTILLFILGLQTTNNAEGQILQTDTSFLTIDLSSTGNPSDFPYGITCDDPIYCWSTIHANGMLVRIHKGTHSTTIFDNDAASTNGRNWYSAVYDSTSCDVFINERDNGLILMYDPELNSWTNIPIVTNHDSPDNANISYPSGFTTEPSLIRLQEASHGGHTYDLSAGSFGEMKKANGYIWVLLNHSWDFDAEGNAILADQSFNGIKRINPVDNTVTQYSIP